MLPGFTLGAHLVLVSRYRIEDITNQAGKKKKGGRMEGRRKG